MFQCAFCKAARREHPGKVTDHGWFETAEGWICGKCASGACWGKLRRLDKAVKV